MTPENVIKLLDLVPLPEEGGFYRETYRDSLFISAQEKDRYDGDRVASTCIYYLVTPEEFSALHMVKSTEIFHFYAGDPVRMIQINEAGELQEIVLGSDLEKETPQVIVPPMTWQGVKLVEGGSWGLMGCTVAPGFEFKDFILWDRKTLLEKYPQHSDWVTQYTR